MMASNIHCKKCGIGIDITKFSDAELVSMDPWTFQHKVCPRPRPGREKHEPKSFTAPKGATNA